MISNPPQTRSRRAAPRGSRARGRGGRGSGSNRTGNTGPEFVPIPYTPAPAATLRNPPSFKNNLMILMLRNYSLDRSVVYLFRPILHKFRLLMLTYTLPLPHDTNFSMGDSEDSRFGPDVSFFQDSNFPFDSFSFSGDVEPEKEGLFGDGDETLRAPPRLDDLQIFSGQDPRSLPQGQGHVQFPTDTNRDPLSWTIPNLQAMTPVAPWHCPLAESCRLFHVVFPTHSDDSCCTGNHSRGAPTPITHIIVRELWPHHRHSSQPSNSQSTSPTSRRRCSRSACCLPSTNAWPDARSSSRQFSFSRLPSVASSTTSVLSIAHQPGYIQQEGRDGQQRLTMYQTRRKNDELPASVRAQNEQDARDLNLSIATSIVTLDTITKNAWPTKEGRTTMVDEAYASAISRTGKFSHPSPTAKRKMRGVVNTVRSSMRAVCLEMVPMLYDLFPGAQQGIPIDSDISKEYARKRVHYLLFNGVYVHTFVDGVKVYFSHPALQAITKRYYSACLGVIRNWFSRSRFLFSRTVINEYETVIGDIVDLFNGTPEQQDQIRNVRESLFAQRILGGRAASTPGTFAPRRSYINSDTYPEDEPVWQWSAPE
ncbi:hypothetical protein Hypma_013777 [Hypsizygus marmoreus]|uniref:DUF6532 domain-containing protein n=1 Tax=Hypsizygus marmoreus TaxID=39966 RepID=A0A369KE06_HYPMA|nr:hypothetical protein Hypma_013777 [Hypsizygus marmoreus]